MGFYIEGPRQGKAEFLKHVHGARLVTVGEAARAIRDSSLGVICVVYNQTWDAAGFAYDEREFARMRMRVNDQRPRRWMVMERGAAERLSGFAS